MTTSIVIRACNEEKHFAQLLEGIARQSLKDPEIILVDSGSTDHTLEIASLYLVRVVHIQPRISHLDIPSTRGLFNRIVI